MSSTTSPISTSATSTTTSSSSSTTSSTSSSSTTSVSSTTSDRSTTSDATSQTSATTSPETTAQSTSSAVSSQVTSAATSAQTSAQSVSSAVVTSAITTTDSSGSTIITTGAVTVPTSRATGGRTSYQTITVTDSSGVAQESVVASVDGNKGGANIGAIVGGTVGGVVGLLAILLLLWFCVFKKRRDRRGDFDDQMFDPGRNRHAVPGQTDILDDEANNDAVEPYTYGQNSTSPQMSQYAAYPASTGGVAPSLPPLGAMATSTALAGAAPLTSRGSYSEGSQSGGAGVARGPSSASTLTSAGFAGRGAQPQPGQMPFSQYYQQSSTAPSTPGFGMPVPVPTGQQQQPPASAAAQRKAREAAQDRQALRTTNPSDGYYAAGAAPTTGGSSSPGMSEPASPGGTSGVVVHSDGGRYMPDDHDTIPEGPSELPPQYHSIRRE